MLKLELERHFMALGLMRWKRLLGCLVFTWLITVFWQEWVGQGLKPSFEHIPVANDIDGGCNTFVGAPRDIRLPPQTYVDRLYLILGAWHTFFSEPTHSIISPCHLVYLRCLLVNSLNIEAYIWRLFFVEISGHRHTGPASYVRARDHESLEGIGL